MAPERRATPTRSGIGPPMTDSGTIRRAATAAKRLTKKAQRQPPASMSNDSVIDGKATSGSPATCWPPASTPSSTAGCWNGAATARQVSLRYVLTDMGRALWPVLVTIRQWDDEWVLGTGNEAAHLVHLGCGEATTAELTCDRCGETMERRDIRMTSGPAVR